MFSFFKKKADILDHWIGFADNFNHSPLEFYTSVENVIKAKQIPGLEMSRIEFSEGGLLSDKRVYLRMLRERLVFDVCAAPFGCGYFFSCRSAEIPSVIHPWQIVVMAAILGTLLVLFSKVFGFALGMAVLFLCFLVTVYLLRNAVAIGLSEIDTAMVRSPVFGPLYERWIRKETYYRIDTRLMYLDTVSTLVKELAEKTAGSKGVKLVRQYEQSPMLGELYKPLHTGVTPQPVH